MARKTTRTDLKQVYEIEGGKVELKITTEDTLTAEALKDFGAVVTACDEFAKARPPRPADVRRFPGPAAAPVEGGA